MNRPFISPPMLHRIVPGIHSPSPYDTDPLPDTGGEKVRRILSNAAIIIGFTTLAVCGVFYGSTM